MPMSSSTLLLPSSFYNNKSLRPRLRNQRSRLCVTKRTSTKLLSSNRSSARIHQNTKIHSSSMLRKSTSNGFRFARIMLCSQAHNRLIAPIGISDCNSKCKVQFCQIGRLVSLSQSRRLCLAFRKRIRPITNRNGKVTSKNR